MSLYLINPYLNLSTSKILPWLVHTCDVVEEDDIRPLGELTGLLQGDIPGGPGGGSFQNVSQHLGHLRHLPDRAVKEGGEGDDAALLPVALGHVHGHVHPLLRAGEHLVEQNTVSLFFEMFSLARSQNPSVTQVVRQSNSYTIST